MKASDDVSSLHSTAAQASLTRRIADGHTLDELLTAISSGREVYALQAADNGQYHLVRAERWDPDSHQLGAFRQIETLKSIFFQPREFLGSLDNEAERQPRQRVVIGVKNCDLSGLKIQDYVFAGMTPDDPRYVEAREDTILVSCDCTSCLNVCFCPVVGETPYPEDGFDINISPLPNHYLIDAGTERGEQILDELEALTAPAEEELLDQRRRQRSAMMERLVAQAAGHGLKPGLDLANAVRGAADSDLWSDFAVDCVECGACNFVCCTCHCFLLTDGYAEGAPARGKQWDSCLLMNFARVAGGGNPRAGRAARLRNRFQKKFSYFPEVLGRYACDGCGRCTEVCTGNIDIRTVLKRAVDDSQSVPADRGEN